MTTLNNNDEPMMKEIEDKDVIFLQDLIYVLMEVSPNKYNFSRKYNKILSDTG